MEDINRLSPCTHEEADTRLLLDAADASSTGCKRIILTGGNWQKWKRVFPTCPCHNIYRDEAVGLKSCKYTWKITKFVKMGNLGNIVKIWYFVNNFLIEARI